MGATISAPADHRSSQSGAWRARHPRSTRRRGRRGTRDRRRAPSVRRRPLAAGERGGARARPAQDRRSDRSRSRDAGAARYARIGQADRPSPLGDRRRGRHLALRRGAGARSARRELFFARARSPRLRAARTDRRRLDHHAVELPAADRFAKAPVRARGRLHVRRQAERDDLGLDAASRALARRSRTAEWRLQCRDRLRAGGRRADDQRSARRHDLLHRLDRGRARGDGGGLGDAEESVDGARAARTRKSSSPMPTSRLRSTPACSAPISTLANVATPARGCCCIARSPRISSPHSPSGRARVPIGDPLDPETKVGAIVSAEHLAKIEGHVAAAKAGRREGARRRRAARFERPVHGGDDCRRCCAVDGDRERGSVRPGGGRAHLRYARRGGRARQRRGLRPLG